MSEDMPTEKMIEDGAKAQAGDGFVCCCNDVGLLAEDFDPLAGRILGDFPQQFCIEIGAPLVQLSYAGRSQ